jgi:hypothetical protein
MFIRCRVAPAAAILLLLLCLHLDPAHAAVQRTFVATTGNDGILLDALPCRSLRRRAHEDEPTKAR